MSTSGLLIVPALAALGPAEQLREALGLFPPLPVMGDDRDPYTPAVLHAETGPLAGLVSTLAMTAETIRWGTLMAHHAMRTPAELRSSGWPVADRHAVNPVRTHLRYAVSGLDRAAAHLGEAARHSVALVEHLHPIDRADA